MLYNLFTNFNNLFGLDNNLILLRSLLAFVISFIFSFIGLKFFISYVKTKGKFQPIRSGGPISHLILKQKIPTMGGLVSLVVILLVSFLLCNLKNFYVLSTIFVITTFAFIGFIDDAMKIFFKNTDGFRGQYKIVLQVIFASIGILIATHGDSSFGSDRTVFIPFFRHLLYLGIFYIPFMIFVVVGTSNAVNLTDGLDGLAIVPIIINVAAFGFITYMSIYGTNSKFITIKNFSNVYELVVMCGAVIGSAVAFFIFNKYPAKIFMGDVGSLMYGSFIGMLAIFTGYEFFLAISGVVFVMEAVSDILQVSSYVLFGKRIFKMAPIHHHFEKSGWSETKVVFIFWTITLVATIIAFFGIIK